MDSERLELLNEDAQVELYLFILWRQKKLPPPLETSPETKKVATEVTTTKLLIYKYFITQLSQGKVF